MLLQVLVSIVYDDYDLAMPPKAVQKSQLTPTGICVGAVAKNHQVFRNIHKCLA